MKAESVPREHNSLCQDGARLSMKLDKLPTWNRKDGLLNVVVETTKGGRNKMKFEPSVGAISLSRMLPLGLVFPYDFGFIPGTRGADGDPLDVLLIISEPTTPGCLVRSRLLGVLEAEQREGRKSIRNDRLIAVAAADESHEETKRLHDLDEEIISEIKNFFVSYNRGEGRDFVVLGERGPRTAEKLVKRAASKEKRKKSSK